ncbi:epidermal growth factor receptor substrate 15 homolog isoform X2 [Telopea speciosissima]|uniref:epidermal growth factor receptor substrate 15 homolog isoform X2 n=1 Tax=Telopea speciosissima TaxID=54955 RepID=UPI001CC6AD2F|nr:epidermal growth factor receptor substrate 15 homolog isoform X2 [Telopea speciosissima]
MEATAGVAAGRGGSLPMPSSQSARKEWRAVSENSVRNAGSEDVVVERSKLAQSEERTIYEQGAGPLDVDFCSITMDGGLDHDILQQRLHSISRQREELQQMEIELKAQVITRSELMEMQNNFDAQIKEHANAAAKLKEQLQEREQTIHELEVKMEEKERELRAIKIDNEAAWAKEGLLREQNKELATIRRERENSEAERAQNVKQIHELQEHVQEKDRQLLEMEEQNRVAQEAILYKDEQLREAQAWIARVQEMDALQSTTNHSLQTELRERTEQFNQIWLDCQRQFAEIERMRLHTIQQLQLELNTARERSGIYNDESRMAHTAAKDASPFGQNRGNQLNVNESGTLNGNPGAPPNGNVDNVAPFVATVNPSTKNDHVPGVPVVPSSLLGMGTYLPPGQMTALHPFIMHQQGVPQSVPSTESHVPQSNVNHFPPVSAISSHPHWQNQQAVSEGSEMSNQNQYPSQTEQNLLRPDARYDYELSGNGQVLHSDYLDSHISSNQETGSVITSSSEEAQVHESSATGYLMQQRQNSQESSSQLHDASTLEPPEQKTETKDENITEANHSHDGQCTTVEQSWSAVHTPPLDTPSHPVNSSETTELHMVAPEASISAGRASKLLTPGKIAEPTLLDEKSLLACIVRAIPAGSGGRIRISSTLPNRLGKMLAPLHWHDYKKKYGKLDDFVAGHPELFVIEGDFIQLREGAQEIISATAAVAKVAAAAAVSAPYSSLLPAVAVTPMAQTHRLKKVPSIGAKPGKAVSVETTPADMSNKPSQYSVMQNQHSNGVCFNIVQGLSNVKILSKPKDVLELNGYQSEIRTGHASVHLSVGNGANPDTTVLASFPNKGSSNGRHGPNFGGKQQGRATGAALTSRR